ncbi:MAG TPA: M28 family peptidase [Acidobacteriaceae bacterium]|jgi:glutaminyl-peptide cyclotransferase|nr:M28 family peptidase [Acidobacteriaceae bacterium]
MRRLNTMRWFSIVVLACATAAPAQTTGKFNGARAMQYTREIVAYGPRYNGSDAKTKVETYFKNFFAPEAAKGWLETDSFVSSTPVGPQLMRNYIVRYPGTKPGEIVLITHYETNYPLRNIPFVGANDGACTSAILMEMANHLRAQTAGGRKLEGYSVWLVFDDGEEAVQEWSHTDSLYGTRHLAAKWEANGTLDSVKAVMIVDMIGDRDLNVLRELNSTPWLEDLIYKAAKNTGHDANFFKTKGYEEDDHLPFLERGVPTADVIDVDYGPHDAGHPDGWHHTAEDTVDKLSVKSLQTSGDVLTEAVLLLDAR